MRRNVLARLAAPAAFAIAVLGAGDARAPLANRGAFAPPESATRASAPLLPPVPVPVPARSTRALAQLVSRRIAAASTRSTAREPNAWPASVRRTDLARAAGALTAESAPIEITGVTHTSLALTKFGLPVFNRRVKRHEGALSRASGELTLPPLDGPEWTGLSRDEALQRASRAVGLSIPRAAPRVERGWFALEDRTAAAWRVTLPALEPFGTWQVIVDARSGAILSSLDLVRYAQGSGSVFVPNVKQANGVASVVPLFDLGDSGLLAGRIVRVIDDRAIEAFRPDLVFAFPPADPRFVQTSAYRALTDTARRAESQGFPAFAEPLHAFVNLAGDGAGGEYNNAFYDPYLQFLGFGNGDGVVLSNVGTDSDVAAHELGHHLFETLVHPLALTGTDFVVAINEGVADSIAALWNGDPDIGESTRPGQPYLRTLANTRVYPDDVVEEPHQTGLIFGGLVWSLSQSLGADTTGRILMAGLPFLPARPQPWEFPEALAAGDQALYASAHASAIASAATARGLDDPFPPAFRGELSEGTPQTLTLADGEYHLWVFYEFPGCSAVTFRTTGTGDVDVYATPLVHSGTTVYLGSAGVTSNESVTFDAATFPSVNDDDIYVMSVEDYPDGQPSTYTLSAESTLPPAQLSIPGTHTDSLATADELDMFVINGVAGQVVRVEAHATTPGLDLAAVVFDPRSPDTLGGNDDSGPGSDPLIQGARFPATRPYAVAVFSMLGDIHPGTGTGSYTLTLSPCNNSGPNTDGDLLVDACDDDDDDDGFNDDVDVAPKNAALCADIDDDGCDDCTSGAFDPFDDGPDADGDAVCDAGDVDRDDDGCPNASDRAPLSPSIDPDLDFLGNDCDDCPAFSNPTQTDTDGDGRGDACECGDQNGDGRNTVSDLVAINLAIFNPALVTPLCDANGDGHCNVGDIVATNLEIYSPGNTSVCARQPVPGP